MDFDSCNQLYEGFPSFMTPEYNIDELEEILRSTDANLSSGIGYNFQLQQETNLQQFPSPPASSSPNSENVKSECESPTVSDFNPDDFINFLSDEDGECISSKSENRNTPSPTNSSSSVVSQDSGNSMIIDTPPVSPPSNIFQLPPNIIPLNTCSAPISLLQGTLIPVKTVPLTAVQVQNMRAPLKISPKPITAGINSTSKPKTIVLSSNDFNALMKKINNDKGNGTSMPKIIMKSTVTPTHNKKTSVLPKVVPSCGSNSFASADTNTSNQQGLLKSLIDETHLKKHQRMIKNRESASLSRKKKKDYVVSLETRINDLEKENTNLKGENTTLRSQLIAFTQTCQCSHLKLSEFITNKFNNNVIGKSCNNNSSFKNRLLASNMKKNTAVLLAMVVMVSLNIGSFHTYFSQDDILQSPKVDFDSGFHTGRRGLLWVDEIGNLNISQPKGSVEINGNETNSIENDDKCPVVINQTENLRLAGELRKWIGVNDYLNLSTVQEKPVKFKLTPEFLELKSMTLPLSSNLKPGQKRNRRNYFNRQSLRDKKIQDHPKNSLKVFGSQIDDEYLKLFEEIKRRDDTFYVLSFNSDHILLPAAAYNKSTRPKMSLMLPAGDPSNNGDITLMQIDCEVLNTTEVQLKTNMIPINLRPKFNMNTPSSRDILNKTGGGPEQRGTRDEFNRATESENKPTQFYRPYFMAPHKHVNIEKQNLQNVEKYQRKNEGSALSGVQFITFQRDSEDYLP